MQCNGIDLKVCKSIGITLHMKKKTRYTNEIY